MKFAQAPFGCKTTDGKEKCSQGDPIENNAAPFLGPSVAFSYGFGAVGPLSELTAALGVTGPSSIGIVDYPKDGAQRYSLTSTDYFIAFLSGAVAVGIGDWLRLGVTGQLVKGKAKFSQAVWSGQFKQADIRDTRNDSTATFEGENGAQATGVFGLTLLPRKDIAIGLSYRPEILFNAPGELTTVPPAAVAGDVTIDNEWKTANGSTPRTPASSCRSPTSCVRACSTGRGRAGWSNSAGRGSGGPSCRPSRCTRRDSA